MTDTDELVHRRSSHLGGDDDGPGDAVDDSKVGFAVFIADLSRSGGRKGKVRNLRWI